MVEARGVGGVRPKARYPRRRSRRPKPLARPVRERKGKKKEGGEEEKGGKRGWPEKKGGKKKKKKRGGERGERKKKGKTKEKKTKKREGNLHFPPFTASFDPLFSPSDSLPIGPSPFARAVLEQSSTTMISLPTWARRRRPATGLLPVYGVRCRKG